DAPIDALQAGEQYLTATATNLTTGDTSEFSQDFAVPANQPPTASVGGAYTVAEGGSLILDASGSSDPDGDTLSYSWDGNGDGVFGDATGVNPTLTWAQLVGLAINDGKNPASLSTISSLRVQVSDGVNPPVISDPTSLTVANAAPSAGVSGPSSGLWGTSL